MSLTLGGKERAQQILNLRRTHALVPNSLRFLHLVIHRPPPWASSAPNVHNNLLRLDPSPTTRKYLQ